MAHLFKPTYSRKIPPKAEVVTRKRERFVRVKRKGKTILAPMTESGERCLIQTEKWYGQFRDANGKWQRVALASDKTVAQQKLAELIRKVERQQAGLVDPFEESAQRSLQEHIDDWEKTFEARKRSEKHIFKQVSYFTRAAKACGWQTLGGSFVE